MHGFFALLRMTNHFFYTRAALELTQSRRAPFYKKQGGDVCRVTSHTNRQYPISTANLCGLACALRLFALKRLFAAYVYFDLFRFGFGLFRQTDLQDAFFVIGLNLLRVHG